MPSDDRVAGDAAGEGVRTDGYIEFAVGDRQAERHAAIEPLGERGDEGPIDRVDLERLDAMNPLASELPDELRGILVSVHNDAPCRFRRAVQTLGIGRPNLHPDPERARQIANRNSRLVRIGQPARKGDALRVLERVRENPSEQVRFRLRWMAGHPQRQRLVDLPVRVCQIDVDVVDGCRQRQIRSLGLT